MDFLHFLYDTAPGRILLKALSGRALSRFCGAMLETKASRLLIPGFIRRAGIDTEEFELGGVRCFNDFFCRPLKPGRRPVDPDVGALVAPCDGLLTAIPLRGDTVLPVKQSRYTLSSLLRDESLAAAFQDGLCLVFRLCVHHYHRYAYFDGGEKAADVFLPGALHTVRPVALAQRPVFAENCRSYTRLQSESFGEAVQMEVGAMLVGKIVNDRPAAVRRGEEKGHFAYGGSTILVLLKRDAAVLREDILRASQDGFETPVRMGERIGSATDKKEGETP